MFSAEAPEAPVVTGGSVGADTQMDKEQESLLYSYMDAPVVSFSIIKNEKIFGIFLFKTSLKKFTLMMNHYYKMPHHNLLSEVEGN